MLCLEQISSMFMMSEFITSTKYSTVATIKISSIRANHTNRYRTHLVNYDYNKLRFIQIIQTTVLKFVLF